MNDRPRIASLVAVLLAGCLAAGAGSVQGQEQIYGSQLMTPQERNEHRQRMQNAKTEAEREALRHEHHARMQERAKAQGLKLPDEPPPGMGGPGRGMGGGGMGNARGR